MISFPKTQVEQFFRTYVITDFTVSKDEQRLVFSSNLNGKMNLWAMDLPNKFPYLYAQADQSASFIHLDDNKRFTLAGFDKDGDENHQFYAIPYEGGLPQPLIEGTAADEKFFFASLSEDGERLYYMTSKANPEFLNTHVLDLKTGEDHLLHTGDGAMTQLEAVSEDEKSFIFKKMFANTFSTAFVRVDGEELPLTPDPETVHTIHEALFTDAQTIHFVTDFESDFRYLAKFDLATKTFERVLEIEGESISELKWDDERKVFYLVTEKGVEDFLYRYEPGAAQPEAIDCPVALMDKVQLGSSGKVYLLGRSARLPHNLFVRETDGTWVQLTENRVLGVSLDGMVDPDVVQYESFDERMIEALLFRAKPENDNGHTIFWPHGGPQSAERKQFRSMFQSFLNRGYSIMAPNFRGSTGYGSAFTKMVERDWGEGPRLDCLAAIDWLFDEGISSPDKLFLVGGSYGGYMALLLHGRHADRFKAVVDIFGVSDLFTFVRSVPPHWKPIMDRWVGDPVRDKERFIKDSPVTYLDGMTKPMLVIQGAKDPRVVKEESDQIVEKLKQAGRTVDYLVLDDEGHGFSKKENEIRVYETMLDFLEQYQS